MEQRKTRLKKPGRGLLRILYALLGAVIGCALTLLAVRTGGVPYARLQAAVALIKDNYFYYGDETDKNLTEGMLDGLAAGLKDTYATYYTEEEYASYTASVAGKYVGIGAVIAQPSSDGSFISKVYRNSPAEKAGLRKGDYITAINGVTVTGMTTDEMALILKAEGSENLVTVRRDGETFTVVLIPGEVVTPYAEGIYLEDCNLGYIRISGFHGKLAEELKEEWNALRERNIAGLVIDLRDNPGGELNVVLDVAEQFLSEGDEITSIRSRKGNGRVYRAKSTGDTETPVVVLMNSSSASASELLAGALQANGRAKIAGTVSFGKGIVQTTYHLGPEAGYLKMTTDAYYTPAGVCIQGTGITPDETVELPVELRGADPELLTREEDLQLQKAVEILLSGE